MRAEALPIPSAASRGRRKRAAFHGAFGVLFGRLSTVQLRGELGYFVNAYEEAAYSSSSVVPAGESNSKRLSHGPMLTVGIGSRMIGFCKTALLLATLAGLSAGCGTTQIVASDPRALITVDGANVGRGMATVQKTGLLEQRE